MAARNSADTQPYMVADSGDFNTGVRYPAPIKSITKFA